MDKKKSVMKPLLAYAGKRKILIYCAIVLSAISQLVALALAVMMGMMFVVALLMAIDSVKLCKE